MIADCDCLYSWINGSWQLSVFRRRQTMENRNDRKSYYKGLLTGVILCVLIIGVLYGYFDSMQKSRLKSELVLASAGTEKGGKDYLGPIGTTGSRLTLVDRGGTVLFDSKNEGSAKENPAGAPAKKADFE